MRRPLRGRIPAELRQALRMLRRWWQGSYTLHPPFGSRQPRRNRFRRFLFDASYRRLCWRLVVPAENDDTDFRAAQESIIRCMKDQQSNPSVKKWQRGVFEAAQPALAVGRQRELRATRSYFAVRQRPHVGARSAIISSCAKRTSGTQRLLPVNASARRKNDLPDRSCVPNPQSGVSIASERLRLRPRATRKSHVLPFEPR